jgi:predicted Zn-dependent protease
MKTKILSLFAVLVLVAFFSSCAAVGGTAQVLQQAGVISQGSADFLSKTSEVWGSAFEDITPEQEYYIGRAVGANVLSAYKIQTNKPEQTNYVNKVLNALVINSPRPEIFNGYHAAILDSDEINAFATPGGHVFITRGLINCTTSEDTLAAVIAHEVAHIQLQHGLRAIKNSRFTQALLVTGTSAASAAASNYNLSELVDTFSNSIGEIVTTMVTNGYSRNQEFDADTTALALMSWAGYEPSSLVDMLKVLEKEQGSHPGGFNKTHPAPAQRITNAQKDVGKYSVPDTRSYRKARHDAVL